MSTKGKVLGNDPFQRGAARRGEEPVRPEVEHEAEGRPAPAPAPAPRAANIDKRASTPAPTPKAAKGGKRAATPRPPDRPRPAKRPEAAAKARSEVAREAPASGAPRAPGPDGLPPWLRSPAAAAPPEEEPTSRLRRRPSRLERAFAELGEAQDVLGKAVAAAGMGGAAVLDVGEELARTVPGLEKALRSLLGPGLAADVQEGLIEIMDLMRRALLRTPARRWAVPGHEHEYEAFGRDTEFEDKVQPLFTALFERYFRAEVRGIENVPAEGRCMLVVNHAGGLPYDGPMLKTAVVLRHPRPRPVRFLLEDVVFHAPFLGTFLNRYGGVRACPENAERLLQSDALLAVFPEGVKGLGKLFRQRYQLQRFGRGGFVKLCLRTGTPLVPVAVVGGEEIHPILLKVGFLARSLGIPYLPVTPTFPILGPLGLIPLPARWYLHFGEPIDLSHYGPDAADDRVLVARLAEQVRVRIQGMVDTLLEERRHVFR